MATPMAMSAAALRRSESTTIGIRLGLDASTVRHAVSRLKTAGLLDRRRGSRELTPEGTDRARSLVREARRLLETHAVPQG